MASNEGVVGVGWIEPKDTTGEARLVARPIGRNIPALGIVVEK